MSRCAYGRGGDDRLHGGKLADVLDGEDGDDDIHASDGDDLVFGALGDDDIHGGAGDDALIGGPGDDVILAGQGNDELEGGSGEDRLLGQSGDDELLGGTGDDELIAGPGDDRVDGGLGDDAIHAGAGADLIIPGPGVDTVDAGGGDDLVVIYSSCELGSGESLDGGGGYDTLISPVDEQALINLGVTLAGFELIEVRPELASLSDCHCFHGVPSQIDDEELVCSCDPGWQGAACDSCDKTDVCAPPATVTELAELLLGDLSEELADEVGAQMAAGVLAHAAISGDLVVHARPIAIEPLLEAPADEHGVPARATVVTLAIDEVFKGPALDQVSFVFAGTASPDEDYYNSEAPRVSLGRPRVFSLRLRANQNFVAEGGSDWKIEPDGNIQLGAYELALSTFRTSMQIVSQP